MQNLFFLWPCGYESVAIQHVLDFVSFIIIVFLEDIIIVFLTLQTSCGSQYSQKSTEV